MLTFGRDRARPYAAQVPFENASVDVGPASVPACFVRGNGLSASLKAFIHHRDHREMAGKFGIYLCALCVLCGEC